MGLLLGSVVLLVLPTSAFACWEEAGRRYGISPQILYAIGRVESRLNPQAVNLTHRERTGTYDIGLMQINSSNLPALARHGIIERDLYNPCTNIHFGAWLLAKTFARNGVTWDGVGAYNAACTQLKGSACRDVRSRYAWLVYRQLPTSPTRSSSSSASTLVAMPSNAEPQPFILAARVSP